MIDRMKRPKVAATTVQHPSRVLIALAAAWLVAALAFGGMSAEPSSQRTPPTTVDDLAQP